MSEWTSFSKDVSRNEWEEHNHEGLVEERRLEGTIANIPTDDDGRVNNQNEIAKIMEVASLTGLTVATAQDLLYTADGDVRTAVILHFERTPPSPPASRPGNPAPSNPQHRRVSDSRQIKADPAARPPDVAPHPTPQLTENDDHSAWLSQIRKQANEASEILRRCEAAGELFVDDLFPADASSLDGCTGAGEVRRWCRPVETWDDGEPSFFEGAVQADDVVQGRAKDCWFLGALAIVASKPGMLQKLVQFSWVASGLHVRPESLLSAS